jgi:hypothetical protein
MAAPSTVGSKSLPRIKGVAAATACYNPPLIAAPVDADEQRASEQNPKG